MRYFIFPVILLLIIIGSVVCASTQPVKRAFVGAAACQSCHKDIFESTRHTAHYFTSRPAAEEFIKGSFEEGKNEFVYNKWVEVVMEKRDSGFWQTSYVNGVPIEQRAFGIVIGSSRIGQTYLYWDQDKLFQLPVSYFKPTNEWCNSPGYPVNYAKFSRPIVGACMECHSTYAETTVHADTTTTYNKHTIMYGIDCERCHGPGSAHVAFHTAHPEVKTSHDIISAQRLSRQQRLDACAMCHSGLRKEIKPAFTFTVGDKLDDFSTTKYKTDSVDALDVHGNQYGLLTASKCFKSSLEMDCSSCHNVHRNEANSPEIFSQRCMTCHNQNGAAHTTCTFKPTPGLVLSKNCIDCHMPKLASKKITFKLANEGIPTPDLIRTHKVAVYLEETKAFVAAIRQ
jgi:hypothetical protein